VGVFFLCVCVGAYALVQLSSNIFMYMHATLRKNHRRFRLLAFLLLVYY
jgi:hypothetical protein